MSVAVAVGKQRAGERFVAVGNPVAIRIAEQRVGAERELRGVGNAVVVGVGIGGIRPGQHLDQSRAAIAVAVRCRVGGSAFAEAEGLFIPARQTVAVGVLHAGRIVVELQVVEADPAARGAAGPLDLDDIRPGDRVDRGGGKDQLQRAVPGEVGEGADRLAVHRQRELMVAEARGRRAAPDQVDRQLQPRPGRGLRGGQRETDAVPRVAAGDAAFEVHERFGGHGAEAGIGAGAVEVVIP